MMSRGFALLERLGRKCGDSAFFLLFPTSNRPLLVGPEATFAVKKIASPDCELERWSFRRGRKRVRPSAKFLSLFSTCGHDRHGLYSRWRPPMCQLEVWGSVQLAAACPLLVNSKWSFGQCLCTATEAEHLCRTPPPHQKDVISLKPRRVSFPPAFLMPFPFSLPLTSRRRRPLCRPAGPVPPRRVPRHVDHHVHVRVPRPGLCQRVQAGTGRARVRESAVPR